MSYVVGIDIGTSGIKVGAINSKGCINYITKEAYTLSYPKQGWMEIDVHYVWEITKRLLVEVIEKVSEFGGDVEAISLSSFCNSSVFMDCEGNPLYPGIMYLDQRSIDQANYIRQLIGEEKLYHYTRNRLEPGMYTVTTLLWTKEHEKDVYYSASKWGNLSTYILKKLSGEFVMDWTQASFSGIFDVVNYEWSEVLCDQIGIEKGLLPKIVDPCEHIGSFAYDDKHGNKHHIPVIAGGADTACSTLALGIKSNEMFESVGTSNVLTVCTENPNCLDTRFLNRCHIIKGQWLSHGAMSTPGASIQWFHSNFLTNETNEILEELPNNSTIGSNGVFFLPYMQGERSPIWDPHARGVYAGLHLNTNKADMLRAIFEGTAYGLKQIYEIIEENYQLTFRKFQSIGGGAKNKTWAQIKSNVLNKEIEIKEISETGVYGAALIARAGINNDKTLLSNSEIITNKTIFTITPQVDTLTLYEELYQKFKELYPSLKSFFSK